MNYNITLKIPLILKMQRFKDLKKCNKFVKVLQLIQYHLQHFVILKRIFIYGRNTQYRLISVISKVIDLEYPQNLLIYFSASEMLSISNHLQFFNLGNAIDDIYHRNLIFNKNYSYLTFFTIIEQQKKQISFLILLLLKYSKPFYLYQQCTLAQFFDIILQKLIQNQYLFLNNIQKQHQYSLDKIAKQFNF
ncbi:unnamed protein product [Paramecium sonneborni]|uniref:Uncharacterized protein n=1 Tax=Paramecium sonneborni TaxID=65129 RepID=A0A8S1RPE7_9CILI|nr:unnamed protein product [Paramecium sonneborni]